MTYSSWIQRLVSFIELRKGSPKYRCKLSVNNQDFESEIDSLQSDISMPMPFELREFFKAGAGFHASYHYYPTASCEVDAIQRFFPGLSSIRGGIEIFTPEQVRDSWHGRGDWVQDDIPTSAWWLDSIPFMSMRNGDELGVRKMPEGWNVVYLSHDGASFVLDESLRGFLEKWEDVLYFWPLYIPLFFLETGRLTVDLERTQFLRSILVRTETDVR